MLTTIQLDTPREPPDALYAVEAFGVVHSADATLVISEDEKGWYALYTWSTDPVEGEGGTVRFDVLEAQVILAREGQCVTHKGTYFIFKDGTLCEIPTEQGERLIQCIPPSYVRHDLDGKAAYFPPEAELRRLEPDLYFIANLPVGSYMQIHSDVDKWEQMIPFKNAQYEVQYHVLSWGPLAHMHTYGDTEAMRKRTSHLATQRDYPAAESYIAIHDFDDGTPDDLQLYPVNDDDVLWGRENTYRITFGGVVTRLTHAERDAAQKSECAADAQRQSVWLSEYMDCTSFGSYISIPDTATNRLDSGSWHALYTGSLANYALCNSEIRTFIIHPEDCTDAVFVAYPAHPYSLYPETAPVIQTEDEDAQEDVSIYALPSGTIILIPGVLPISV